eukprot:GHRR01006037.1.p1 GENE.GHRR01006037.1~~GHRR01006037.1.p1  ORF type:complete len:369 (+),score=107.62 GHRR01006037.1:2510-3616(+)
MHLLPPKCYAPVNQLGHAFCYRPLLPHHTDKTPAEQSVDEVNPALYGDPHAHYKMPAVNMGSSIVTAMPTMVNEGGALDTVSKGETVVRVPGSAEVHHLTGIKQHPGDNLPSGEELAHKLRDTAVHDMAPPGATVLAGQKAAENEAAFDERALPPGAAADSPAGDEEHALARGQHGDKVRADFVMHKVGMVNEELTAADMYPRADDSKVEPISSVKQPGVPKCEMCACAPCQCGQMRKTGGTSNDPFELTYPEQKRGGRPHIHSHHREVTGKNAHEARDYRGHAKQGQIEHAHIGAKLGDYQGNVSEGIGDPNDPKYQHLGPPHPRGATHTGGAPIEFPGEPGRRQVSDAVAGGPMRHGAKTNIHTLG